MMARRDGHADLADVRSLVPLRDTTDELCTVAKGLKLSTGASVPRLTDDSQAVANQSGCGHAAG